MTDVDEVGVVECGGRAFERRVVELPARGPHLPEQLRDLAAVLRKPAAPALGVEIVRVRSGHWRIAEQSLSGCSMGDYTAPRRIGRQTTGRSMRSICRRATTLFACSTEKGDSGVRGS